MYKFKSFISYSRAADTQLAPAIKSALQGFAKSWYKLRAIQVFCDQTNLTANPNLWSSIEKNLGNSEYFIYLASPQAAQSKWVRKEISYFNSETGAEKMIIILTDGEISWDEEKTDFNWELTDAVPKFDTAIFMQEPVWIDLRWIRKEQLSARDPRFLDAIANLSSVLRGIDKDTLIGKDVEEHRKAKRFRLFSMTGLSLLALFLVIATLVAVKNLRLSQDRLTKTYNNNGTQSVINSDYAMALPWYIEAWQNERDNDRKQSDLYRIENLFNQLPVLTQVWQEELPVITTAFRDNNTVIILSGDTENWMTSEYECLKNQSGCRTSLKLLDIQTGREAMKPIEINDGIRSFALSRDKTLFASLSIQNVLRVWNLRDGQLLWQVQTGIPLSEYSFFSHLDFNRQNDKLLFVFEDRINIYDAGKGALINNLKGNNATITDCSFLADGNTVAFLNEGLYTWNATTNKLTPVTLPYYDYLIKFKLSPDYTHMVMLGAKKNNNFAGFGPSDFETIAYLDIQHMQEPIFTKNIDSRMSGLKIQFDDHQHVLGINSSYTTEGGSADEGTRVWDLLNGNPLSGWIKFPQEVELNFDSSGRKIAITCRDGSTEIWQVAEPGGSDGSVRNWIIHDGNEEVKSIFSPGNQFLLTSGWGRIVKLWKIPADDFVPFPLFDDLQEKEIDDTIIKWNVAYDNESESGSTRPDSSLAYVYDIKTNKKTGKPLKHNSQVYLALRSYDGTYIATAALNEACVWKGSTQEKLYTFSSRENAALQDISFSPDSKRILTSFTDYTCRVWDAATGNPITPYIKHLSGASYVDQSTARFSADGEKIITSDNDTYWIWDSYTGEPLSAPLKVNLLTGDDRTDSASKKTRLDQSKANSFTIHQLAANDLRNYASLLAGHQLDINNSFTPLSSEEFLRRWSAWRASLKKSDHP